MSPERERLVLDGETWITIEDAAAWYHVEVAWVERVAERGLLGGTRSQERSRLIAARRLDRLAEIVRLHLHQGVELDLIALLLSTPLD